jgi:predicted GNAT superfamily acetyltransferase
MQNLVIRDATPSDFETICALNLAEIQHTSAMDVDRLAALDELSCYHKIGCVAGSVAAFLLAMCNGAPYENDNFAWFLISRSELWVLIVRGLVSLRPRQRHPACDLRIQYCSTQRTIPIVS